MKIWTEVELGGMDAKEVARLATEAQIPGRSKMKKAEKIRALLVAQTAELARIEKERPVKKLEGGAWREFVGRIQRMMAEGLRITEHFLDDYYVNNNLKCRLLKEEPTYHPELVAQGIRQASGFLAAEAEASERITRWSFGGQDFDGLVAELAGRHGITPHTARAAVSGVISEVARKVAEAKVTPRDTDKDPYALAKDAAGGFIDRAHFFALLKAVTERQIELRAELAREAEAAAIARAEAEAEATRARAEAEAKEKARAEAKKARIAEIRARTKRLFVFTGGTSVMKAVPVDTPEEAQMLVADAGKPLFVFLDGAVVKASNSKGGRLETEPVSCRTAADQDFQAARTRRLSDPGEPEDNTARRTATAATFEPPSYHPMWITGENIGTVRAAVIVNAPQEMHPLSYVCAAKSHLKDEAWVAVERYGSLSLFRSGGVNGFVPCSSARQATPEEKRAAKAKSSEANRAWAEAPMSLS